MCPHMRMALLNTARTGNAEERQSNPYLKKPLTRAIRTTGQKLVRFATPGETRGPLLGADDCRQIFAFKNLHQHAVSGFLTWAFAPSSSVPGLFVADAPSITMGHFPQGHAPQPAGTSWCRLFSGGQRAALFYSVSSLYESTRAISAPAIRRAGRAWPVLPARVTDRRDRLQPVDPAEQRSPLSSKQLASHADLTFLA